MDPTIDHRRLLEEVLVAPAPSADPVAPILSAVRTRRRQRRLAPLACAAAVAVLACVWIATPWPGASREVGRASQADIARAVPVAVPKTGVERVRSKPLSAIERASTTFATGLVRFHTLPDDTLRASDGELLAMAGGRGVGLFRINGRTELLFAADAARSASE